MKNRFDKKYDIRLAKYSEIPEIMAFIDKYWRKGHILATNREFFEYEMVVEGNVNFIIAKANNNIEGLLGYLPCSNDKSKYDTWGVIWKTIDCAEPMLGMELKKRLMSTIKMRTDLGIGANLSTSVPLLGRIYHYYTAKMKHYYRLANRSEYRIAIIKDKKIRTINDKKALIREIKNAKELDNFFDFSTICDCIPYKDLWYFNRRFFNHPIYIYDAWGISDGTKKAVMFTRTQKYNGSSAVHIVDYIGEHELFACCGQFFNQLLINNEYIDFYFDGFDENYVISAGMNKVEENDINIIPEYFNPYVPVNIDIYVDSSNKIKKCTFFKADGDQDRPS